MKTQTGHEYWSERARKAGLTQSEILSISMESSEALLSAVRQREKNLRESKREIREGLVSVEGNTLEFSVVFAMDHAESKLTKRRIELKNGNYLEVYSHPEFGMIREFDLNLLLLVFKLGQKNQYQEYEASSCEIACGLGYENPSKKEYELIRESFKRLGTSHIETNYWYSRKEKKRVRVEGGFNFLQSYTRNPENGRYTIRLSEWVEESIRNRYLKQIAYDEASKLRGASKIIHLNLAKLLGKKQFLEISEELILRWLGRWEKYNAMTPKKFNQNMKRHVDPKVKDAVEALGQYDLEKEQHLYRIYKKN